MITSAYNNRTWVIYGLSSDEKPVNSSIGNGTIFIEVDTSNRWYFDEEKQAWSLNTK